MAVAPVNVARVSQNLRAFHLLNTVRASQAGLFRVQNQLATGLRFGVPSEDPLRASAALKFEGRLDALRAVQGNLRVANETLRSGESGMQDAVGLVRDAHVLAIETASDTSSPDERRALATIVQSLLEQTVAVGNRKHLNTYLFSGHFGDALPFALEEDGVVFRGDDGRAQTIVDSDLSQDSFTISGREFFNAVSTRVTGFVDLDPRVTNETRIADLGGATGRGVKLGSILVSDGAQQVKIDLSHAATVGDVIDKLNAELPAGMSAGLTASAIQISGASVFVDELPGGQTATDLGIRTTAPAAGIVGQDLNPRITERTRLSDLRGGAGVDLSGGVTIRNGTRVTTIQFTTAQTVEDVLNAINQSSAAVWARIGSDGRTIEVLSRLSGPALSIEENGGAAATSLGLRSMHLGTKVSELNDGLGVTTVEGPDFRVTTASGAAVDVDLDAISLSSATLRDVVDLINAAGAGVLSAALAPTGNGIVLTDLTSGPGMLRIERLNVSPAIDGLGLDVIATGNQLRGRDVNPIKVDSPFTGLIELKNALASDDPRAVGRAGERLGRVLNAMQEVQGRLASKARTMQERAERVESETSATTVLHSDVRDADVTEAIVRFQQMQTALEANLASAQRVLNLSLIDFLR